jgi:anti-anti-sigma factor
MAQDGSVHYLRQSDDLILYVDGEITAPLAQSMYAHIAPEPDPPSFSRIFIELSRAGYIDSTTVGTFIKLKKILAQHNGVLFLCNMSEKVQRILTDMHLLSYFAVRQSDAVADLRREVLTEIPPERRDLLSAEYLLDAHNAIIGEAPELQDEFNSLIAALKTQVDASPHRRSPRSPD